MSIVLQGSTSGRVTLQEPAVAGTTVLTLPAVTGTVLTDTSPKAGNVIQVVNATYSTEVTNSTTSYADTGLTASITPTSSSSKILVIVSQPLGIYKATSDTTSAFIKLLRGSTAIQTNTNAIQIRAAASTNGNIYVGSFASLCYLDSPATTSSTTYKTQIAADSSGAGAISSYTNATATITLMEIAA